MEFQNQDYYKNTTWIYKIMIFFQKLIYSVIFIAMQKNMKLVILKNIKKNNYLKTGDIPSITATDIFTVIRANNKK